MNSLPKKLLLTGATGLLGYALLRETHGRYAVTGLARHPESITTPCPMEAADLQDADKLQSIVQKIAPDIVIHAAAMTSVDQCEKNPELAHAVNVGGTQNLLKALQGRRARFIFISTDSVFDGTRGNYSEEDSASPLHVYGRTKLQAEETVLRARSDALVIRTAFYGWNVLPQTSLAEWILTDLKMGRKFRGFTDVFFSPLLSDHLAQAILQLAAASEKGILHVAGRESCSKYQFARQLAVTFGFDSDCILPVTSTLVQLQVRRPKNVSLCIERAGAVLGRPLPNVLEGLTALAASRPHGKFAPEGVGTRGTAP